MYNKEEELIPLSRVLEDMSDDVGFVSHSARDYYYQHYATEEQRISMDREDRISSMIFYGILSILLVIIYFLWGI